MTLNVAGEMIQTVWDELPGHYPGVETDAFVVMPNHIHGIIVLTLYGAGTGTCPYGQPEKVARQPQGVASKMLLADAIQRFKSLSTARYRHAVVQEGWRPFAGKLWQRNYYEHIIRDEAELDRIRQYIFDNPARWDLDEENPSVVGVDSRGRPSCLPSEEGAIHTRIRGHRASTGGCPYGG